MTKTFLFIFLTVFILKNNLKFLCVRIQYCSSYVFVIAGSDTKLKDAVVPKSLSSYSDHTEIVQESQPHRIETRRYRNQHFTYNKARHHKSLSRDVYGIKRCHCVGFGWGSINFLHSSSYETVFWICIENVVDKTGMLLLLLSSAYTVSRAFLFQEMFFFLRAFTPYHQ